MSEPADSTEAMASAQITQSLRSGDPLVLGGRYELTQRIASGGMASVWRAHDDVLARTVAVKLLHDHLAADDAFRERFRREAIAAAKLTHPNVVSLYDTGSEGDRVYLVMEFVDGATLREVIADLGTMSPGQAAAIGERIARALDYAHERGLVHRDVKPANILMGDDGSVKVADFGIAKADENDGDLTKTGMVLGTAAYVAPEQITGEAPVDGRADQYALGCMLYEALTGRQPFKGDSAVATAAQRLESAPPTVRAQRPDVPRGLDTIISRAMARNPEDRFVSAGALADALAAFADPDMSSTAALPLATLHRAASRRTVTPPAGFPTPAPARAPDSFLRSEGRWLLAVLVLIGVAGAFVGIGITSGLLDASNLTDPAADPTEAAPVQREDKPLKIDELEAFDPEGDGGENDENLPALLDDDESTTWRTDIYGSAEFGGLKDGVGFTLDLGQQRAVRSVELDTETAGLNLDIRAADEPGDDLDDWQSIGRIDSAPSNARLELDDAVETRYLLVWVASPLPESEGGYKAEFGEVRVRGATESAR